MLFRSRRHNASSMKKWKVEFEVVHHGPPRVENGDIVTRLPNIVGEPFEVHADERPTEQQIHNLSGQKLENIVITEIE